MQNKTTENIFNILIGEKLSSVTFVMDYLQIDFDGNRFTLNIWPVITIDKIAYKINDNFYRDKLCSLITKVVEQITFVDDEKIVIDFGHDNFIFLSLDPTNPDIVTPEIADFSDTDGNLYVF